MPPELKHVRIVAPSGPLDTAFLNFFFAGCQRLHSAGFSFFYSPDLFQKVDYVAGSVERRLKELLEAFADPAATYIMAARGGYGLSHLMPDLWRLPAPASRLTFIGFSDFTLLHLLAEQWKCAAVYSPMVANESFVTLTEEAFQRWALLISEEYRKVSYNFPLVYTSQPQRSQRVEGILRGGCLRLLVDSLGTPWQVSFPDATILYLEDVNEPAYKLDRLWTHFSHCVDLRNVKAVVWGILHDCPDALLALKNISQQSELHHIHGLPVGHGPQSDSLRLLVRARLETDKARGKLTYL